MRVADMPEHRSWRGLRKRCSNPNSKDHGRYLGRGIKVCDRWRESFENFLADMGPKPSPKHTIDRINNDGNYEPSNCRWATAKENVRNRTGYSTETHCRNGHEFNEKNTFIDSLGKRTCRSCRNAHARRYRARKREEGARS